MTAVAPPAHAGPVVVNTAATSAATAAAAAAAARNARLNREAVNDVIVNPTEATIAHAKDSGQVDWTTTPYIYETVREMNIAPGTKPDNITETQRGQFQQLLAQKRLVAEMSADTQAGAEAKGLDRSLSQYFAEVKAELGFSGPVNLSQARQMEQRMEDIHWERDTKPALKVAGMIGGGIAVVAGAGYAISNRRRRDGYGY